jgi:hypothetical protein
MIFDVSPWQYALLLSNVFLLGAAALALVQVRRELRDSRRFWQGPTAASMQGEAYDDRGLRRMIDDRIAKLAANIERTQRPPAAVEQAPVRAAPVSFEHATRMARQGASIDDLVLGCGLNKGEAQLLLRMHANNSLAESSATH